MSNPIYPDGGKMAAYRLALIDYLDQRCVDYRNNQLSGDISWDYPPEQSHGIGQNPQGSVLLGISTSQIDPTISSGHTKAVWSVRLCLRLSHGNTNQLIDWLNAWQYQLLFEILPPLTRDGITGSYAVNGTSIAIDKAFWKIRFDSGNSYPEINQESGGNDAQLVIIGKWEEWRPNNELTSWS
jgi:hypothetical protein